MGGVEGVGKLILNQTAFNVSQELVAQHDLAGPRPAGRPGASSEVACGWTTHPRGVGPATLREVGPCPCPQGPSRLTPTYLT